MAKSVDKIKNMLSSLAAVQTLTENFPMSLVSFGGLDFHQSWDVLGIIFKILKIDRDEVIEALTDTLCGNMEEESNGFIAKAEDVIKIALETNIIKILNCTTNPIISNELLDRYETSEGGGEGEGIILDMAAVDYMGYLKRNPCTEEGSRFYFDVKNYTAKDMYKSRDFNAYLWYIINRGDDSQKEETVWDNRCSKKAYIGPKPKKDKKIIRCTYIDNVYPNTDKLRIQLCGETYGKTRKLFSIKGKEFSVNKTIFEFNHDFLSNIRLYDPKVIISELADHLMFGSLNLNISLSIEEKIIQEKVNQVITHILENIENEVDDCYFSFSNDEYDKMLNDAEQRRNGIINGIKDGGNEYKESFSNEVISNIDEINKSATKIEQKTKIKETFRKISAVPAQDEISEISDKISYDYQFEMVRAFIFPFIRPLFTPKVMVLLLINEEIMGGVKDYDKKIDANKLIESLYFILRDIVSNLWDMIFDIILNLILKKLKPLLEVFASRLLHETVQAYKDLLLQLLIECGTGWGNFIGNGDKGGTIDNVNYADIIEPNNSLVSDKNSPNGEIC